MLSCNLCCHSNVEESGSWHCVHIWDNGYRHIALHISMDMGCVSHSDMLHWSYQDIDWRMSDCHPNCQWGYWAGVGSTHYSVSTLLLPQDMFHQVYWHNPTMELAWSEFDLYNELSPILDGLWLQWPRELLILLSPVNEHLSNWQYSHRHDLYLHFVTVIILTQYLYIMNLIKNISLYITILADDVIS